MVPHSRTEVLPPINQIQKPPVVVDAAARKWDELINAAPPGAFTAADADALGAYCVAWLFYTNAVATLAREGLTITGPRGPRVHPMVEVKRQQEKTMESLGDRLGLTPAARASGSWWGSSR